MSKTNIKIETDLIEKVKTIAENKFPLRNITSYAEATREALIDFIKKNRKFLGKDLVQNQEELTAIEEESS